MKTYLFDVLGHRTKLAIQQIFRPLVYVLFNKLFNCFPWLANFVMTDYKILDVDAVANSVENEAVLDNSITFVPDLGQNITQTLAQFKLLLSKSLLNNI